MSALTLTCSYSAISPGLSVSTAAIGGTSPYTYSVRSGGAGGSIDSSTGLYTAPAFVSSDNPLELYDTLLVNDSASGQAQFQMLIGSPLLLFCDIIQNQMGLAPGRVYLWDQKIFQPSDSGIYIPISILSCKPFGNTNSIDGSGSGLNSVQSVNMQATLSVDIISRSADARDRKEEIVLALNSNYSEQQQELNSFSIGRLPAGSHFTNLSYVDGAAIPYRFSIQVNIQYSVKKIIPVPYFSTFQTVSVATNP